MADILGPACENAVTVRPARTVVRGSNDTWFKDCSSTSSDDGTALPADWFNDILAQLRVALASSGIDRNGADDMLWRAMQSVGLRYAVDSSAAANAIVIACTPPVTALTPGLAIAIKIAHTNSDALTVAVDGLATKAIKWPNASAIGSGMWPAGGIGLVMYDGANFQLLSRPHLPSASFWRPGEIIIWPDGTPPDGALECDGSTKLMASFPSLYAAVGTKYGGDGITTFKVPDYRGVFLRGWDHTAGNDPDRTTRTNRGDSTVGDAVGTRQGDQNRSHTHPNSSAKPPPEYTEAIALTGGIPGEAYSGGNQVNSVGSYVGALVVTIGADGGGEARPKNVNVMFCIAY